MNREKKSKSFSIISVSVTPSFQLNTEQYIAIQPRKKHTQAIRHWAHQFYSICGFFSLCTRWHCCTRTRTLPTRAELKELDSVQFHMCAKGFILCFLEHQTTSRSMSPPTGLFVCLLVCFFHHRFHSSKFKLGNEIDIDIIVIILFVLSLSVSILIFKVSPVAVNSMRLDRGIWCEQNFNWNLIEMLFPELFQSKIVSVRIACMCALEKCGWNIFNWQKWKFWINYRRLMHSHRHFSFDLFLSHIKIRSCHT